MRATINWIHGQTAGSTSNIIIRSVITPLIMSFNAVSTGESAYSFVSEVSSRTNISRQSTRAIIFTIKVVNYVSVITRISQSRYLAISANSLTNCCSCFSAIRAIIKWIDGFAASGAPNVVVRAVIASFIPFLLAISAFFFTNQAVKDVSVITYCAVRPGSSCSEIIVAGKTPVRALINDDMKSIWDKLTIISVVEVKEAFVEKIRFEMIIIVSVIYNKSIVFHIVISIVPDTTITRGIHISPFNTRWSFIQTSCRNIKSLTRCIWVSISINDKYSLNIRRRCVIGI